MLMSVAALSGCMGEPETNAEPTPAPPEAAIPPLDTQAPAETETATFALG